MSLRMTVGMLAIAAPMQLLVGDLSGRDVLRLQPFKLAAIVAYTMKALSPDYPRG